MGKKTRQLWKQYLEQRQPGRPSVARSASANALPKLEKYQGTVLGIDPSLRSTGIALITFGSGDRIQLLHHETIRIQPKKSIAACLATISERSEWLAGAYAIDHVAVELTIYVQNYQTAMVLGTAKGAALATFARNGLEIFEYPPLRVKQAVVGNGRASKDQVARMVGELVGNQEWKSMDETDAAGVALCHGFTYRLPARQE